MATPWSLQEATPRQIDAIQAYEMVSKTKIDYKNKQDAHDVISQFCGDGLTFEDGFIKNTRVPYIENGRSVNGKTLSNNHEFDTLRPIAKCNTSNLLSYLCERMNEFSDDDDYCFGGADPYTMFY